jgi:hypothetical protein
MGERNSEAAALEDSPSDVEEFLSDAVEMKDVDDPDLGDVQAEPGEVIAVVDGVEIRHVIDDSDHVLSIEDDSGEIIGKDSFPDSERGEDD